MKRYIFIFVAAIMAMSMSAQKHEIGAVVGGLNGLSYKYWISANTAVQTDLAVGLTAAPTATYMRGSGGMIGTASIYDFTLNPNLFYHFPMTNHLKLYIGGGVNFGLMSDLNNTNPNLIMGKAGVDGACGMAINFDRMVMAFDFRPGYGLGFKNPNTPTFHFFDWKLGLAFRYCL